MKLALLLLVGTAVGQTISPVIVECGKKCSGTFTVKNNQTIPASVYLESNSFSLTSDSKSVLRKLDSTTTVILDATSARIAPLDSRVFSYKIICRQLPCAVQITAVMTASKKSESGMQILFGLPEVVYVCERKKDCRKNVRKEAGIAE
jgi:hypothetical protein